MGNGVYHTEATQRTAWDYIIYSSHIGNGVYRTVVTQRMGVLISSHPGNMVIIQSCRYSRSIVILGWGGGGKNLYNVSKAGVLGNFFK